MGKTMMSVFLTEELEGFKASSAVLLFYFCEGRDQKRNSAINILRGLIFSLLRQRPKLIKHILPDYEVREDALFQNSSIEAMWRIFEDMVRDPETGPVYCVIDGLDECSQSSLECLEHFLKKVSDFFQRYSGSVDMSDSLQRLSLNSDHAEPHDETQNPQGRQRATLAAGKMMFKLALLSREDPDCMVTELAGFPRVKFPSPSNQQSRSCSSTQLSASPPVPGQQTTATFSQHTCGTIESQVAQDYLNSLTLYIESKVDKLAESHPYDDALKAHLKEDLKKRGNGTFLWIDMAIDQLRNFQSRDTQKALENLPDGVDGVCCQILLQIPPERIPVASFVIRWVTTAFRPLTVQELNTMLYFLNGQPEGPLLETLKDAIDSCGNLLSVSENQELSLAHATTKDLLTRETSQLREDPRLQPLWVNESATHAEVAYACLSYLEGGSLQEGPIRLLSGEHTMWVKETWQQDTDRLTRFPFANYAIFNWTDHLRKAYPAQANFASPFFGPQSPVRRNWWLSIWEAIYGQERSSAPNLPLLHLAAFFDLRVIAEQLAQQPGFEARLNKKDTGLNTPLWIAGYRGSVNVFTWLLDHGAKQVCNEEPVLNMVARRGQTTLVTLVLDRGMDVNHNYVESTSAKGMRFFVRHAPVLVDISLRAADEIDKKQFELWKKDFGSNSSALHSAAAGGHEAVVKLLVDRGANIHHVTTQGWNVIHFAAWAGVLPILQFIVQRGVFVQAMTEQSWTALHCAAFRGRAPTIEMLANLGVPVDAFTKQRKTALHLAASEGHEDAVRTLVARGANLETRNSRGQTALHLAAIGGQKEVVKALLEAGANRDVAASNGDTPIKLAKGGLNAEPAILLRTFSPVSVDPSSVAISPFPSPPPLRVSSNSSMSPAATASGRHQSLPTIPPIASPDNHPPASGAFSVPPITYNIKQPGASGHGESRTNTISPASQSIPPLDPAPGGQMQAATPPILQNLSSQARVSPAPAEGPAIVAPLPLLPMDCAPAHRNSVLSPATSAPQPQNPAITQMDLAPRRAQSLLPSSPPVGSPPSISPPPRWSLSPSHYNQTQSPPEVSTSMPGLGCAYSQLSAQAPYQSQQEPWPPVPSPNLCNQPAQYQFQNTGTEIPQHHQQFTQAPQMQLQHPIYQPTSTTQLNIPHITHSQSQTPQSPPYSSYPLPPPSPNPHVPLSPHPQQFPQIGAPTYVPSPPPITQPGYPSSPTFQQPDPAASMALQQQQSFTYQPRQSWDAPPPLLYAPPPKQAVPVRKTKRWFSREFSFGA